MEKPNTTPVYSSLRNCTAPPAALTFVLLLTSVAALGAIVGGTQIVRQLIKDDARNDLKDLCDMVRRGETPPQLLVENTYRIFNLTDGSRDFICNKFLGERKKE